VLKNPELPRLIFLYFLDFVKYNQQNLIIAAKYCVKVNETGVDEMEARGYNGREMEQMWKKVGRSG